MKSILGAMSLALALTVATCEPAHAVDAEPSECMTESAWVQTMRDKANGITIDRISEVSPDDLKELVDIYNNTPPVEKKIEAESGIRLGATVTSTGQRFPSDLIGFFSDGCRIGSLLVEAAGLGDPA